MSEIEKPGGVRCAHVQRGGGCGVYETRPASCRHFICLWLALPEMPHALRPDLSKVVLGLDENGDRMIAHCDPANPLAWRRQPMFAALKDRARAHWGGKVSVLAKAGRRVWLIRPHDELDLGEIDPLSPVTIWHFPDGTSHHVVHPPLPLDQAPGDSGIAAAAVS